MSTFTDYLTRKGRAVQQRVKTLNLKQRFSSASNHRAALAMTMRIAVLPLIPLTVTATVPSAAEADQPPSTTAVLSVRTAPVQMADTPVVVSVAVGESLSEETARKEREAAAATKQKLAAQTDRVVLSRYRDVRTNGGLSLDDARTKTAEYAAMYGVDAALMTKIIACESGYNQFAQNSRSSASGYGQFLSSTWNSTARALGWDATTSSLDGDKNLQAVAYLLSVRGTSPWQSSAGCWSR